ncbi:MAG: HEAT repeat domain-containing protein [Labilithrix sp.]
MSLGPAAAERFVLELASEHRTAPGVDGRAAFEDLARCARAVAVTFPDQFFRVLDEKPAIRGALVVVTVLASLPSSEAADRLAELLDAREPWARWLALESLVDRGDPRGLAHVRQALADDDDIVVLAAALAARRFGTSDLLPALASVVSSLRYGRGVRAAAESAISSIRARAGVA